MASYYGLIIFYPIISTLFVKWTMNGSWFKTFVNEVYLWVGFSLTFGGLLFILFNTVRLTSGMAFPIFILYTILYISLSVIRKILFNGSVDIRSHLNGS